MASFECGGSASLAPFVMFQNAERNIILLDIPKSIAAAQARSDTLLSTKPLEEPIYLGEEHGQKPQISKTNIAHNSINATLHTEYKALIDSALAQIHAQFPGPWCAPRKLMAQMEDLNTDTESTERELESQLIKWAAWGCQSKGGDIAFNLNEMMASLGATSEHDSNATVLVAHGWQMSCRPARESATSAHATLPSSQGAETEPWTPTFHNPRDLPLQLTVSKKESCRKYRFTVPPRSTFFLSDSTQSDAFRAAFRELTDDYTLSRHFDLVLLDPPWPNRSAKRAGAYVQVGGMPFSKKMMLRMDIDSYLEHNALVGVWITNKDSLRNHVLGPGGLFETWNVGLEEEWIWIKTTAKGEPMFDINAGRRRPYEVLLLGRAGPNSWTTMAHAPVVKRRVIAAVPDVHSRKPCLKGLFETFGLVTEGYNALEIFSRYLVSGWMSWGNEVLKFNWDEYWTTN